MKQKLKKILLFIANPRLLLCFAIAWMITNGWSYVLFAAGTIWENEWLLGISGAYLAFLWLPVSPEKLVTVAIAIALLRFFFPNDEKTLAVLHQMNERIKTVTKEKWQRLKRKKKRKKESEEIE